MAVDTQSPNKPMPPRYWVGAVLLFALLSLGLYGWPNSLAGVAELAGTALFGGGLGGWIFWRYFRVNKSDFR